MIDDPMDRIAAALERMAPAPMAPAPDFGASSAFVWQTGPDRVGAGGSRCARVPLDLLGGSWTARAIRCWPIRAQFAQGSAGQQRAAYGGARGMGKSSLVKAVHMAHVVEADFPALKIVELAARGPAVGWAPARAFCGGAEGCAFSALLRRSELWPRRCSTTNPSRPFWMGGSKGDLKMSCCTQPRTGVT